MQDDEKTDAFKAALGDADAEIVSREGGTAILAPLRAVAVDVAVLAKLQAALAIPARLSSHASFQVSADGMGSVVAVGTAAPLTDIAAVQAIAKPDRPQSLAPERVMHRWQQQHRMLQWHSAGARCGDQVIGLVAWCAAAGIGRAQ